MTHGKWSTALREGVEEEIYDVAHLDAALQHGEEDPVHRDQVFVKRISGLQESAGFLLQFLGRVESHGDLEIEDINQRRLKRNI